MNTNWGAFKTHFKPEEFADPTGANGMNEDFMSKLFSARVLADTSFKITSGFRTPEHNAKVGGSKTSSHLFGLASDIEAHNSIKRSLIISSLLEVGFTRIGIGATFIHVDLDPIKTQNVIWLYQ